MTIRFARKLFLLSLIILSSEFSLSANADPGDLDTLFGASHGVLGTVTTRFSFPFELLSDLICTEIPLTFDPVQSYFIVFRATIAGAAGRDAENFPMTKPAGEIAGPWEVSFQPGRGAPARVSFDRLDSWSNQTNPGVKFFSGEAVYRKSLTLTRELAAQGKPLYLDLGRVEVMAEVTVNGHTFDTLWCAPYRLDISSVVKPGENLLAIKVVNLWPNRMIGDAQLPPDSARNGGNTGSVTVWPDWLLAGKPSPSGRITWASNDPFSKDSPLLPSGLLGPVKLQIDGVRVP